MHACTIISNFDAVNVIGCERKIATIFKKVFAFNSDQFDPSLNMWTRIKRLRPHKKYSCFLSSEKLKSDGRITQH